MAATKKRVKQLSWNPVRRGEVYCAPACGRGCTYKEYQAAFARGKSLLEMLNRTTTFGFKIRIHDNMGWHVSVVSKCGRIRVSPYVWRGKLEDYHAMIGHRDGSAGFNYSASHKSPLAAISAAICAAKASLAAMQAWLGDL